MYVCLIGKKEIKTGTWGKGAFLLKRELGVFRYGLGVGFGYMELGFVGVGWIGTILDPFG